MKKLVQEMLQVGIIRDNNSAFVSPIMMVKKKMVDGGYVWTIGN